MSAPASRRLEIMSSENHIASNLSFMTLQEMLRCAGVARCWNAAVASRQLWHGKLVHFMVSSGCTQSGRYITLAPASNSDEEPKERLWCGLPVHHSVANNRVHILEQLQSLRHAGQLIVESEPDSPPDELGNYTGSSRICTQSLVLMMTRMDTLSSLSTLMESGAYKHLTALTLHIIIPTSKLLTSLAKVRSLRKLHITNTVNVVDPRCVPRECSKDSIAMGVALQTLLESVELRELDIWGAGIFSTLPWIVRALPRMTVLESLTYNHYSEPVTEHTTSSERVLLADQLSTLLMEMPRCPTLTTLHIDNQYNTTLFGVKNGPVHTPIRVQYLPSYTRWPVHLSTQQRLPSRLCMLPHPNLRELHIPEMPLFAMVSEGAQALPALERFSITSDDSRVWGHMEAGMILNPIVEPGILSSAFVEILDQMQGLQSITLPQLILPNEWRKRMYSQFCTVALAGALSKLTNLTSLQLSVWDRCIVDTLHRLRWILDIPDACRKLRSIIVTHASADGKLLEIYPDEYAEFLDNVRGCGRRNPECIITIHGDIHQALQRMYTKQNCTQQLPSTLAILP